jgi:hypothetical protein
MANWMACVIAVAALGHPGFGGPGCGGGCGMPVSGSFSPMEDADAKIAATGVAPRFYCTMSPSVEDMGYCNNDLASCTSVRAAMTAGHHAMTDCSLKLFVDCVSYDDENGLQTSCSPTPDDCEVVARVLRRRSDVSAVEDCVHVH